MHSLAINDRSTVWWQHLDGWHGTCTRTSRQGAIAQAENDCCHAALIVTSWTVSAVLWQTQPAVLQGHLHPHAYRGQAYYASAHTNLCPACIVQINCTINRLPLSLLHCSSCNGFCWAPAMPRTDMQMSQWIDGIFSTLGNKLSIAKCFNCLVALPALSD